MFMEECCYIRNPRDDDSCYCSRADQRRARVDLERASIALDQMTLPLQRKHRNRAFTKMMFQSVVADVV